MEDSTEPDQPPPLHPAADPKCRFNPWLFFGFLVAPAILAMIILITSKGHDYGAAALLTLIIGCVVAGFVCGIHFTRIQRNLSGGAKWAVGVLSVIGCAGVAFALGFGGCFAAAGIMGNLI